MDDGMFIKESNEEVIVRDNQIIFNYKSESASSHGENKSVTIGSGKFLGTKIAPSQLDLLVRGQTGNKISFPVKSVANMHYISIEIAGESVSYLIDSGASFLSITPKMENRMKEMGILRESDYRGEVELELADNSTIKLKKIIIPVIKIGDQSVNNVEAVITDGSLLLGRSVINKFKSWSLDNSKNILVVEMY